MFILIHYLILRFLHHPSLLKEWVTAIVRRNLKEKHNDFPVPQTNITFKLRFLYNLHLTVFKYLIVTHFLNSV